MSILGFDSSNTTNHNNNTMSKNSFFDFKKQASFYIKEKIKSARLVLTDVTPAQLMTEEATNGNPWSPDTKTLGLISRAAFEVDDYWRIVNILHNKLSKFERKNWRESYKALIVLEHLLTHGPESVAEEFQSDKLIINNMETFQHVDERGFNWGLSVRKKSEKVLKLLEKGPLLKEERVQARKLTREIKGFGSFSTLSTSQHSPTTFGRSHSQFNEHGNDENSQEKAKFDQPPLIFLDDDHHPNAEKPRTVKRFPNENKGPRDELRKEEFHVWNKSFLGEKYLLLNEGNERVLIEEEDHPFNDTQKNSRVSLLAATKED